MMRRDNSDAAAWASSCETVASSLLGLSLLLRCLTSVFVTTWAKADEEVARKLAFVSPALFFHFFSLFPPFHRLHFPHRALLPPITLPHSQVQSSADDTFAFACEEWAALFFFFCGWGRESCCFCCFCCCICRCCVCCCCCLILFNWVWILANCWLCALTILCFWLSNCCRCASSSWRFERVGMLNEDPKAKKL